ncbi:MAG: hypothetical protein KA059_07875 [Elusimicrobiales bacterium]|nr:hypothetical protein [Elusimicrobiales bacterium]
MKNRLIYIANRLFQCPLVKSDKNIASEFEKDLYDDLLILYLSETERLEEKALDYFKKIKKNGMRYRKNMIEF